MKAMKVAKRVINLGNNLLIGLVAVGLLLGAIVFTGPNWAMIAMKAIGVLGLLWAITSTIIEIKTGKDM